jgi:hypothetical protein
MSQKTDEQVTDIGKQKIRGDEALAASKYCLYCQSDESRSAAACKHKQGAVLLYRVDEIACQAGHTVVRLPQNLCC